MTGKNWKSHFYIKYSSMLQRCTPNYKRHKDYFDKGITVCKRWQEFKNFKHDMYEKYLIHYDKHGKQNTQLDRIDNNKGYSHRNCRWATIEQQMNNTSQNKFLTHGGCTMTVTQWARKKGINNATLRSRIKRGWSVQAALTLSLSQGKRPLFS